MRDYIFIAALRLKTNEAEIVCRDRAKTCWWSWRTTPWTWLTLWARPCSTLSPLAASVCGVLAETTAGQCPSTQVQIGTGLRPGSLVSATREVTDGLLLLIGVVLDRCACSDWCVALFYSFLFRMTQRFGILWRLSWQAQPCPAWACLLYTAALSWIDRALQNKRMPVWLLTVSLFLTCCVLCLEQGKVSMMNFLHCVPLEFFCVFCLNLHDFANAPSKWVLQNARI